MNVESIRMIICADQILVLSVPDPLHPNTGTLPALRHPFIKELVSRCASSSALSAIHAILPVLQLPRALQKFLPQVQSCDIPAALLQAQQHAK